MVWSQARSIEPGVLANRPLTQQTISTASNIPVHSEETHPSTPRGLPSQPLIRRAPPPGARRPKLCIRGRAERLQCEATGAAGHVPPHAPCRARPGASAAGARAPPHTTHISGGTPRSHSPGHTQRVLDTPPAKHIHPLAPRYDTLPQDPGPSAGLSAYTLHLSAAATAAAGGPGQRYQTRGRHAALLGQRCTRASAPTQPVQGLVRPKHSTAQAPHLPRLLTGAAQYPVGRKGPRLRHKLSTRMDPPTSWQRPAGLRSRSPACGARVPGRLLAKRQVLKETNQKKRSAQWHSMRN